MQDEITKEYKVLPVSFDEEVTKPYIKCPATYYASVEVSDDDFDIPMVWDDTEYGDLKESKEAKAERKDA